MLCPITLPSQFIFFRFSNSSRSMTAFGISISQETDKCWAQASPASHNASRDPKHLTKWGASLEILARFRLKYSVDRTSKLLLGRCWSSSRLLGLSSALLVRYHLNLNWRPYLIMLNVNPIHNFSPLRASHIVRASYTLHVYREGNLRSVFTDFCRFLQIFEDFCSFCGGRKVVLVVK